MNGSNAVASMVKENTRIVQEQIEFSNKYEALTKQYEKQKNSLDKAAKKPTRQARQLKCELTLRP